MATLFVPREQVSTVLDERIRAGEDLLAKAEIVENTGGHGDWIYVFKTWREHTLAELRAVYDGDEVPHEFDSATSTTDRSGPRSAFPGAKWSLELGVFTLGNFVKRLPLAVEPEALQVPAERIKEAPSQHRASAGDPNIFIVHGRAAGGFLDSVARFVAQLGLTPVILAEQANEGRTLIEKFEANALKVGYAIALLTPEDIGYALGDDPPPSPNRARQNVILELGYFMAKLGRTNVVALQQEGLEVPTDILGIVYIPLDDGGAWKTLLARELQAAGYDLDARRLLG